jgi:proteasome lid subunit RPN8/RPN11
VVVVPPEVREAIAAHARDELPNECCGLILLDDGVAVEYIRATNKAASPYRFELFLDPIRWSEIELEQGIVHSHPGADPKNPRTAAKPSRTDVENIGWWKDRPYLIYSVARDELAAWRFVDGAFEALELG